MNIVQYCKTNQRTTSLWLWFNLFMADRCWEGPLYGLQNYLQIYLLWPMYMECKTTFKSKSFAFSSLYSYSLKSPICFVCLNFLGVTFISTYPHQVSTNYVQHKYIQVPLAQDMLFHIMYILIFLHFLVTIYLVI